MAGAVEELWWLLVTDLNSKDVFSTTQSGILSASNISEHNVAVYLFVCVCIYVKFYMYISLINIQDVKKDKFLY